MERDIEYEMKVLEQMYIDALIDDKEYDEQMNVLIEIALSEKIIQNKY